MSVDRRTYVGAFGQVKTVAEWVTDQRCEVGYDELRRRIEAGWEAERAITRKQPTETAA